MPLTHEAKSMGECGEWDVVGQLDLWSFISKIVICLVIKGSDLLLTLAKID